MDFKRIESARLYEHVLEQIRHGIAEGRLRPGDRLPTERELADRFAISRGTLREAFRVLEQEGLIETRHGSGRYVREVSDDLMNGRISPLTALRRAAMLDLLEARELLEERIVQLACQRASDEDLRRIEEAMESTGIAEPDFEPAESSLPRDHAFHLAIAGATHNSALFNMMYLGLDLMRQITARTMVDPDRKEKMFAEHRELLEALKARDPERAQTAARRHFRSIREHLHERGFDTQQSD